MQMVMFMKNLALIGGALTFAVHGAGAFSLDARLERRSGTSRDAALERGVASGVGIVVAGGLIMRLENKRVLITGTGGGQGKAAQALFAREGARVIGCDVQQGTAERSAAELRDQG